MEFPGLGFRSDFRDVAGMKTRTRHNGDTLRRCADEFAKDAGTFGSARGSAGSEDASSTGFKHVFKSTKKIWGVIESAVEGHVEWASGFDQFASAFDIYSSILLKNPERDAVECEIPDGGNGAKHDSKFGVGVNKVARSGANDGEHRDFNFFVNLADCGDRRSDATANQFGAEFETIGTATFGSQSGVQRFDSDF